MLTADAAQEIGCLGYVARASGLANDARIAHAHSFTGHGRHLGVPIHDSGDVLARFLVRTEEIETSFALIEHHTGELDALGTALAPSPSPGTGPGTGVGLVEGWRGTIATCVELTPDSTLAGSSRSTRPSSTGPHGRWRWPTRSSPTSP
ncbi:NADH-quinone oxidoreductase subunit D-related protein [Streptomyces chartreusis]|uniref:NADH-quinone oxidoreductase subunit D-related protein n=1 Tax=Streptomyces chartreusis TaxID=1969 RepID=UPI003805D767